nr:MAG TPA: hypothetical protein [Caudoviricetes sp.]
MLFPYPFFDIFSKLFQSCFLPYNSECLNRVISNWETSCFSIIFY